MRLIALLIGGCLTATGALAQSKTEMQQMLDDLAAAFNKGDAAKVAMYYKSDATLHLAAICFKGGRTSNSSGKKGRKSWGTAGSW
jgi:hypothetical protein